MASWRQLGKRQQSSQLQPYPRNAVIASWAAVPADDGDRPTLQSPLRYRSRTPVDPDAASAVGHAGFLRADSSRQSIGFSGFSGFVQEPAPEESRRESTDWRYANGKRQPSEVRPQAWERGQLEERRGTHYYGTNGIARCRPASGS